MTRKIVIDIETLPCADQQQIDYLIESVTADARLKDPEKIASDIAQKRSEVIAKTGLGRYGMSEYKYKDGIGVAMFQIVQMYDSEWPRDMREAGQHEMADLLESFIRDEDSITLVDVLHLRDYMAGCVMQRDASGD